MLLWRETEMKEKKIQNKRMETEKKIRDTLLMLFNFPCCNWKKAYVPANICKVGRGLLGVLSRCTEVPHDDK